METDVLDALKRNGRNFTYHPPDAEKKVKHEEIRSAFVKLANLVVLTCPKSRERNLALTKLEEGIMWANASIARN